MTDKQSTGSKTDHQSNADLIISSVYTVGAGVLLLSDVTIPVIFRVSIALPLLIFTPGYAIIAAFIPRRPFSGTETTTTRVSLLERIILAVAMSVAGVGLVALLIDAVADISLFLVFSGVIVLALGATVIATHRRTGPLLSTATAVPHMNLSMDQFLTHLPSERSTIAAILIGILLLSMGIGVSLTDISESERDDTEFALVTRAANGSYIAANYPRSLTVGEDQVFNVLIEQHGSEREQYTVIVLLNRATNTKSGTQAQLGRFRTTVRVNETAVTQFRVTPPSGGDNRRLTFLLYRGNPGDNPDPQTAHRQLHLTVDIE